MFCHFKKLLGWTQCKINILSSTSQVAYWLHSKLLSNHVYHACGFNRFGWLVYIYILRPWITTRSFSFDIMRNSFGDLFYFVLFKLFQSYLSTSLNIRWINLKKNPDIIPFSYTYLIAWFHTTFHPLRTNRVISQMSWQISFWESWVVNKVPIHKPYSFS